MQTTAIDHILTLNPADFARYAAITVVTPKDVVASVTP